MGSFGTIALKDIWAMLGHCAPGFTKRKTDHHWCVMYNGNTYPTLPLGSHGKRENPEIQRGHVKRMARILGISECAREQLGF